MSGLDSVFSGLSGLGGAAWWLLAAAGAGILLGVLLAAMAFRRMAAQAREIARLREIQAGNEARQQSWQQAQDQLLQQQKLEFQLLAGQVLEEKGRTLSSSSQTAIDAMLRPLRQQIDAFQQRVNQVHDQAVRGNAELGGEIRRVMEVGLRMRDEAQSLARALKGDKKLAGNWGEAQLEQTLQLAGLVRGDHYQVQVDLKDGQGTRRMPDVVVNLPDGKHIVIDSKVSLVDYDRAMSAPDDAERQACLDAHVRAVRAHVDDLSRKDYSALVGVRSPGFVLMFLPIEAAYIAALQHDRALFDDGYRRNVVLVSHTTLLPVLKTVANLWVLVQGNAQAQEISDRAGDIYNQVALVAERLRRLGDSLDTVSRHYNGVVTALAGQQGLYGKVDRFRQLSARASRDLPDLQPSLAEHDSEKLDLIVGADAAAGPDGADRPVS